MFKHIIVPVDGSSNSSQAIAKALGLAQAFKSRVTVVCVIDAFAFTGVGVDLAYGQAEYLEAATNEARLAVSYAEALFAAGGMSCDGVVVEGQAVYKSILEVAEARGADLIVMGSHGRKGLERLVLGSVAAQVLSHTQLPVMIVRE